MIYEIIRIVFIVVVLNGIMTSLHGQPVDSTKEDRFSIHYQTTTVSQYKPAFKADYTGTNSLLPAAETQSTITSTIFAGINLWKGASLFVNGELSGGSGLSSAVGIADATNGESF